MFSPFLLSYKLVLVFGEMQSLNQLLKFCEEVWGWGRGDFRRMSHSLSIFSVKAQTARANTKILLILSLVGLELLFQDTYLVVMFSQTVMWLQNYI